MEAKSGPWHLLWNRTSVGRHSKRLVMWLPMGENMSGGSRSGRDALACPVPFCLLQPHCAQPSLGAHQVFIGINEYTNVNGELLKGYLSKRQNKMEALICLFHPCHPAPPNASPHAHATRGRGSIRAAQTHLYSSCVSGGNLSRSLLSLSQPLKKILIKTRPAVRADV